MSYILYVLYILAPAFKKFLFEYAYEPNALNL